MAVNHAGSGSSLATRDHGYIALRSVTGYAGSGMIIISLL